MNARSHPQVTVPIAAVERDTGLSKDTLRMWERRYGFPRPGRDAFGERAYPLEQVDKLRLIKRLMDQGHRPGKIIGCSTEQLQELAGSAVAPPRRARDIVEAHPDCAQLLDLLKQHRIEDLRRQLSQSLLRLGLLRFVVERAAPLNDMVGEAWSRGQLEIFEEHLYTESMQTILRNAVNAAPRLAAHQVGRPRVLLTTLPQEQHALGILMAEALLSLEGSHCIALGVQTPVWDIVRAATAQGVDIVALSFSIAMNPNHVLEGLAELRAKLPASIEVWAGGAAPVLLRRPPREVHCLRGLDDIAPALQRWRAAHRRD